MTSYCSISDAYNNKGMISNNNDMDELDKLARQVNNNKKKQSKDIYRQYRNSANVLNDGIYAFRNLEQNRADKGTNVTINKGFYSAQGDYSEYKPNSNTGTLIADICGKPSKKNKKKKKYIVDSDSDGISLDTPSDCSSDSSSFSSISWDTRDIDKEIKTKSKFSTKKKSRRHKCMDFDLDSVDSLESLDSGESLLRHIRFCQECKKKVMDLIRHHKTDTLRKLHTRNKKCLEDLTSTTEPFESNIVSKSQTQDCKKENKDNKKVAEEKSNIPELKEIFTVCLIGFLVIVVLDLVMRKL